MKLHTSVRYDNTSNEFEFQGTLLKVKATVTIYIQKIFVIDLATLFSNGYT